MVQRTELVSETCHKPFSNEEASANRNVPPHVRHSTRADCIGLCMSHHVYHTGTLVALREGVLLLRLQT